MKKFMYALMLVLACALLTGCGMRMSVKVTKKGKLDENNIKSEYLFTKDDLDSLKESMPDYIAKLEKTATTKYDGVDYYAADAEEFMEEYGKVLAAQSGDLDDDDESWIDDSDDDDFDWDDEDFDDIDYDTAEEPAATEQNEQVDPSDFVVTKKKFVYKYVPDPDADTSSVLTPYILRVTMPKPIGQTNGKIDPNDPCTVEFNIKANKAATYKAKVKKAAKAK